MVKRKAEFSFYIGSNLEGSVVAESLPEVPVNSEQGATAYEPTGEERPKVPTSGHISPTPATVAQGEALETHPFWTLLVLAGYQTW